MAANGLVRREERTVGLFICPDPEGEPDPDYPGRIRYVPTGNELMKVYDTSAIVSA